ncbi:hypothetical protein HWV62_1955 [Athelia sp. TMB]|nr:hypothetical protein HWV62_1955 [Athelia sp. TMB]
MTPQSPSPQVELRTPRLLLRGARADALDAADLFEAMRDAQTMRYWSSKPHDTAAETAAWLADKMVASPHNGVTDFLIVAQPNTAEGIARPTVVGKAGCWDGQEIGFLLHRAYWGRGYAAEAVGALLAHMWQSTGVRAVTADVDLRNAASLALLRKFGFEVTGEERNSMETHIGWCDSVYLSLARPAGE